VEIAQGAETAVLGDGKLGLLAAHVLQAHGADVSLFGRHEEKLRLGKRSGIKTHAAKRLPAARFDIVVEATGSQEGLRAAVSMTRPRGTVVMKSTIHAPVPLDAAPVIVHEITLVGSRCGRFEAALPLLGRPQVAALLTSMVADQFALHESREAFARAAEKGVLKVLLRP